MRYTLCWSCSRVGRAVAINDRTSYESVPSLAFAALTAAACAGVVVDW